MKLLTLRLSAFTLIELLFVVAVIAVLAAISVPNFLEAQTRSKIARTHVDMAALRTGLSRYYADTGAYPPNHPEVRRYLDAAMLNPVMSAEHTTAPDDAKVPWYKVEREADGSTSAQQMLYEEYQDQVGQVEFPPLVVNGWQLSRITTPMSYLGTTFKRDSFSHYKSRHGFIYVNTGELYSVDNAGGKPNGLWGDYLTSATYFILGSAGPDQEYDLWHPLSGPWIDYNPTNGTMSNGDLLVFEGRRPGYVEPEADLRPKDEPEPQWFW